MKIVVSAQENNCGFRVNVTWRGWVKKIVGYEENHIFIAFIKK